MNTPQTPSHKPKSNFLGVHFVQCNTYGRFYRNKENTAYLGRCPRCGRPFNIRIGTNGTNQRFFKAHCH